MKDMKIKMKKLFEKKENIETVNVNIAEDRVVIEQLLTKNGKSKTLASIPFTVKEAKQLVVLLNVALETITDYKESANDDLMATL